MSFSPTQIMLTTKRINRIEISATMAVAGEAEQLRAGGADLVDFGAGEPHFQTPQHIKDAAIAAIQSGFTKYTGVGGTAELRDAIARRHATDFGSAYKREETMASAGAKQALFNLFQVLVDHGDEVIIPVPYWVTFKDIVQYGGGVPVLVETEEAQGFLPTSERIERAITPRTKVILLNSPSNPSGAVMDPEEMAAIVRAAAKRNIFVVTDECYLYLDFTGKRFSVGSLQEAREHMIIIGSLSKTYAMTGWRLGYAMGPKALIAAMTKLQSQSTSNPNSIAQKAAVAALCGPQNCIEGMNAEYIALRDRLVPGLRAIPGIQCQQPYGAFYAYPNVSAFFGRGKIKSAADVARRLLHEAGVVTVPGEAFGTTQHLRFSYAASMPTIERGLERMRKFFAAL